MKKSLFALAALGAFAGAASAQSNVTLYGTLDMAVTYINNAGMAAGATAPTSPTATPSTGNALAMTDYGIFSNVWGLKGEEDLGSGLKGIFNLEGDIIALNGTVYNNATNGLNQIFRRAANVGLSGSFGTVRLGQQGNPLVAASANLLPVEGNSVNLVRTVAGYSVGDFLANAISYETPKMGGLVAKVAYSMNNQVDDTTGGSAWAANAFYDNGPFTVTLGYNQQSSISSPTSNVPAAPTSYINANVISCAAGTVCDLNSQANVNNPKFQGNLKGYVAGVKYKVTPSLTVGYGFGHADYDSGTSAALVNGGPASAYNSSSEMLGVGYQATPSLLLGLNYIVTNLDSNLWNAQARYSLSKRTMLYTQVGIAKNGAGSYQINGKAFGNFSPVQVDTSGAPAAVTNYGGLPNTTQTSVSFGVVHNF